MASSIPVLFEDNHLLVVEKPSGLPTQADSTKDPDLLTTLKADIKERYQKPGEAWLGLCHRLDRPVGGVIVFARTSKAAGRLATQIQDGSFEKEYLAVVIGTPDEPQGALRHFLRKDTLRNTTSVVLPGESGAKEALLRFRVLESRGGLSLLAIKLETGRSHQIRVQMNAIGHPLFGDLRYGEAANRDYLERLKRYRTRMQAAAEAAAEVAAAEAAAAEAEADVAEAADGDVGKVSEERVKAEKPVTARELPPELPAFTAGGHTNVALWSYRVSLLHPTTKERMTFLCPPPDSFPFSLFTLPMPGKA